MDDRLKEALTRSTTELDCPMALMCLASRCARETIVAQIRSTGRKPWDYRASEITIMGNEYLAQHPELIARAADAIRRSPSLRKLAEREVRDRVRRLCKS